MPTKHLLNPFAQAPWKSNNVSSCDSFPVKPIMENNHQQNIKHMEVEGVLRVLPMDCKSKTLCSQPREPYKENTCHVVCRRLGVRKEGKANGKNALGVHPETGPHTGICRCASIHSETTQNTTQAHTQQSHIGKRLWQCPLPSITPSAQVLILVQLTRPELKQSSVSFQLSNQQPRNILALLSLWRGRQDATWPTTVTQRPNIYFRQTNHGLPKLGCFLLPC